MKHLKILAIGTALLATGCAQTVHIAKVKKTFYGETRAKSDIAIIKPSTEPGEFTTTLSAYAPPPTNIALQALDHNTIELQVDPGEYVVELGCYGKHQGASPKARFKASAGITYELACERNTFQDNKVRAKISKTYVTE